MLFLDNVMTVSTDQINSIDMEETVARIQSTNYPESYPHYNDNTWKLTWSQQGQYSILTVILLEFQVRSVYLVTYSSRKFNRGQGLHTLINIE